MANNSPTVLVVGQHPDPHVEAVCNELENMNIKVVLFLRHSGAHTSSLHFGRQNQQHLSVQFDETIDFKEINSVWWRMKPHMASEFSGGMGSLIEKFRVQEWGKFLKSLPIFLSHAKWINPLENNEKMSFKAVQLSLATKVGLKIPNTIITNCFKDVIQLFDTHDEIIYKTLSSFIVPPEYVIYTTKITREDVNERKESFPIAPGIYQEYIAKSHELRVMIINNDIYITHIDSQSCEDTITDWRKNQLRTMYKIGVLTFDTLEKLKKFHKEAGLIYAAYDFIVTENGEEIFLECNPGGQWLWLEHALNIPVSNTIARELINFER